MATQLGSADPSAPGASRPHAEHPRRIHEDFTRLLLNELTRQASVDLTDEELASGDAPVLASLLLEDAWRQRATDIHIDPQSGGYRLRFRIDGLVYDAALLTAGQGLRVINQFKTWARLNPVTTYNPEEARWSCDVDGSTLNMRLSGIPCIAGEKLSIRVLDPKRVEHRIHTLGLDQDEEDHIHGWLKQVDGMFVVVGPTGSGKTTTLYALLHELRTHERSIVAIEDPIEYEVDGISQVQVDRRHELTFATGVRTMLRLDPDYLMVGEIRDEESAHAAMDAASFGRVIFTTMHAPDTVGSITTLRHWGLKNHQIAVNLSVVVSQRLVRVLCTSCKERRKLDPVDRAWLKSRDIEPPHELCYPTGCPDCGHTGYRGRTGIYEVWRLGDDDYTRILKGTDERAMRYALLDRGHRTLRDRAVAKVKAGITSVAELQRLGDLS